MEQFGRSSEDNKELPYNSAVPLAHRDTSNIPTLEATKDLSAEWVNRMILYLYVECYLKMRRNTVNKVNKLMMLRHRGAWTCYQSARCQVKTSHSLGCHWCRRSGTGIPQTQRKRVAAQDWGAWEEAEKDGYGHKGSW